MRPRPSARPRLLLLCVAVLVAALVGAATVMATPAPAQAAQRGVGFGTWAPTSAYGWHGSMLVDGVHTYCISPGRPLPVGATVDRGVRADAAGLSPRQLTGINLLVTRYGQTDDPVQAAAVGWAVKAIADWDEMLHHFGYRGDSLAGAIHWTFSALAPEHNDRVQELAVAYYTEAQRMPAAPAALDVALTVHANPDDPMAGFVRVDSAAGGATGSLRVENAVFTGSSQSTLEDPRPGEAHPIRATPPEPGRAFRVDAVASLRVDIPAAVRLFTTSGGQDTAGPAGPLTAEVVAADTVDRVEPFAPTITTQVDARYTSTGPFEDEVRFADAGGWPRAHDGTFLPAPPHGRVYRTLTEPVEGAQVPAEAELVGTLSLTTAPHGGPTVPYRVVSEWPLDAPGFYTAVWAIHADDQHDDVARSLGVYAWTEAFGERSQVTMRAAVTSRAEPSVTAGDEAADVIVVADPVPIDGLLVSSALYRAPDDTAPAEACTPQTLVWRSEPIAASAAGEYTVTSPPLDEPGTYYWRERAVDIDGTLVHEGACGVPQETTEVVAAAPAAAAGPDTAPEAPQLAATGIDDRTMRTTAALAVSLIGAGVTLLLGAGRRRFGVGARVG